MNRKPEELEEHIERLIEIANRFEFGKVHILTGGNAQGKSMIRKIMKVSAPDGSVVKNAQISMEQRTTSNPDLGALSTALHDLSWIATSMNSWGMVKQLLGVDDRFLVLDEPEIGMGREVLLGTIDRINAAVVDKRARGVFKGMCVITHSEFVVRNIKHDVFLNIEGMTESDWLTRKITSIDPEEVSAFGSDLMQAIQKRIEENREKN